MMTPRLVLTATLLGAGLWSVGCDDPVPPNKLGAVRFDLIQGEPPTQCPNPTQNQKVGSLTSTEKGVLIVDGENGGKVDCSVIASGAGFSFSASIKDSDGNSFNAQSSGPVVKGQKTNLSVDFSNKVNTYSTPSGTFCTIDFDAPSGEKYDVAAGRIWAHFTCDSVTLAGSPSENAQCKVSGGVLLFENCNQ